LSIGVAPYSFVIPATTGTAKPSFFRPGPIGIYRGYGGWDGTGSPPDSLGNLGDVAYSTTLSTWYEKRWVGNREGVGDGILFPINLFPSVGDFDFECMVRRDSVPNGRAFLVASSPDVNNAFHFRIENGATIHDISLRSSAGVNQYLTSGNSTDTAWHKLGARRVGNVLTALVDGVVASTVPGTSGWTPALTQTGTSVFSSVRSTASTSIKACNFRLTAPGGTITARLDEGAGTVITNTTGPNGTLTDASPTNFWYQAWVPMEPGQADFRSPANSGLFPALFA